MKLEELLAGVGIQRDHGSLAVLVADEHDPVADGERAERLARADRALDAVVSGPLPQDLSRAGINARYHAVDGRESSMIVEHADAVGAHVGGRIHQRPYLDRAAGGAFHEARRAADAVGVGEDIGGVRDAVDDIRTRGRQMYIRPSRGPPR